MNVGTERIREIVKSLRIFSRLDEAEVKAIDIHEGMDSTLMILQNRLKESPDRIQISVMKDYASLPLVQCYAGQLNQVFMNILANSIDALEDLLATAPTHQPHIKIWTKQLDTNWIEIGIADNGPGIPEAIQQQIFDPFFTTKPVGKGTGMGMSISYQIITEKHQGQLECVSTAGQGTTFLIRIPIHQASQD
jgi:signal transduction histidine kinase